MCVLRLGKSVLRSPVDYVRWCCAQLQAFSLTLVSANQSLSRAYLCNAYLASQRRQTSTPMTNHGKDLGSTRRVHRRIVYTAVWISAESAAQAPHLRRCSSRLSGSAIAWRLASTILYPKGRKYSCGFAPCQLRFGVDAAYSFCWH
jgi:hypothetical protein